MALAESRTLLPTGARTVALVHEHSALRVAITHGSGDAPIVYPCYRFTAELRHHGDIAAQSR